MNCLPTAVRILGAARTEPMTTLARIPEDEPPRAAAVQGSVGADPRGDARSGSWSGTCGRRAPNALRPLGDLFIRLVRMIVAPIIFCTVVHGIASVGEARRVGRVAVKALIYFEIVTTFALVLGPRCS